MHQYHNNRSCHSDNYHFHSPGPLPPISNFVGNELFNCTFQRQHQSICTPEDLALLEDSREMAHNLNCYSCIDSTFARAARAVNELSQSHTRRQTPYCTVVEGNSTTRVCTISTHAEGLVRCTGEFSPVISYTAVVLLTRSTSASISDLISRTNYCNYLYKYVY